LYFFYEFDEKYFPTFININRETTKAMSAAAASKTPPPDERFKTNFIGFARFIGEKVSQNKSPADKSFSGIIAVLDTKSGHELIEVYVNSSHHHWIGVAERNRTSIDKCAIDVMNAYYKFFWGGEDASFGEKYATMKVDDKQLFNTKDLETYDKYMASFIRCAIAHIHEKRAPYLTDLGDPKYGQEYFNHVRYDRDEGKLLRLLGVNLKF
jgi:hypothetical protein